MNYVESAGPAQLDEVNGERPAWAASMLREASNDNKSLGCSNLVRLAGLLALEEMVAPGRAALEANLETQVGMHWLDKKLGWFTHDDSQTCKSARLARSELAAYQDEASVAVAAAVLAARSSAKRRAAHAHGLPPLPYHVLTELYLHWWRTGWPLTAGEAPFRRADSDPASSIAVAEAAHLSALPGLVVESAVPTPVPVDQFDGCAWHWFAKNEGKWKDSHRRATRDTLLQHLLPRFGHAAVSEVTRDGILDFRIHLATLPGRAADRLSNKRINAILSVLRQILCDAALRFGLTTPYAAIAPLPQNNAPVQPFSLAEVQHMVDSIAAPYRNYLQVRFLTGMRTGEVNGLKWKYVDFEAGKILVRERVVLAKDEPTDQDGPAHRDIQMSEAVRDALIRQHGVTATRSEYVFANRKGNSPDNTNFINRVWKPLLWKLRLTPRRPYNTRHTTAALWMAAGERPAWIAAQLGIESVERLYATYGEFAPPSAPTDGRVANTLLAPSVFTAANTALAANDDDVNTRPIALLPVASSKVSMPSFEDCAKAYLLAHEAGWTGIHSMLQRLTVHKHLLHRFWHVPVDMISTTDILLFEADIAKLPGRTSPTLSPSRIKSIVCTLRGVLQMAAHEHGVVSPYKLLDSQYLSLNSAKRLVS